MDTNTNPELEQTTSKSNMPEQNDPERNTPETTVPEKNVSETNEPETDDPETNEAIPENAFLIIEGLVVHPLRESVVNIGRRLDNQVVIDDPRISRQHAQLRAIKGHFVLFDLQSTGGTFVNGQRTIQTVLYPNDEISLAGVIMIFDQDIARLDLIGTSPLSEPGSMAQPTAITERKTVDIEAVSNEPQKREDSNTETGTLP
jgi:pSer/pThr/pTyr-binding forkhead associated (FHA) protein